MVRRTATAHSKIGIWVSPADTTPIFSGKKFQASCTMHKFALQTEHHPKPHSAPPMLQTTSPAKNIAVISACQRYRYRLDRPIHETGPTIAFMLHNPSTADADRDDPTSRRGIGFARRWNAGHMVFVNPFAGRATNPKDLWKMDDPIGPENDFYIRQVANEVAISGGFFVFAWGAVNPPARLRTMVRERLVLVEAIVHQEDARIRCFGWTQGGHPKHPLYLRNDAELIP